MRRLTLLLASLLTLVAWLGVAPLLPLATASTTRVNGRIAFSRFDPQADDSFTYILSADGSVRPLLPEYTSGSPDWSPDGRHVAVISGLGQPCSPTTCTGHTVIIDPSDGSWRALSPMGMPEVGTFCSLW